MLYHRYYAMRSIPVYSSKDETKMADREESYKQWSFCTNPFPAHEAITM